MSDEVREDEVWNEVYGDCNFKTLKRRACNLLNYYVNNGYVLRGKCEVCDSPKTEGHHPDYNLPLDVVWSQYRLLCF